MQQKKSQVCFVAVILKVLLVNLLAALNFANVFLNKKPLENKKNVKTLQNVTKIKKRKKTFFTCMVREQSCWNTRAFRTKRHIQRVTVT